MNVRYKNIRGFSLLELVIGITVLSIALTLMTGALFPQMKQATAPWLQVRSAELAQSFMSEILSRRYDENSYLIGNLRCGESGAPACASWIDIANCNSTEESSRLLYDDVDDFNCLTLTGAQITNIENVSLNNVYRQFTITVSVTDPNIGLPAKLITVTVSHPDSDAIIYSSYKVNY